jgi:hypothetical protein
MTDDQRLRDALRLQFEAAAPDFTGTLRAAERRAQDRKRPRIAGRWLAAGATLGALALAIVSLRPTQQPSLDDDLQLAQTVSYDKVWRAPSDALLAQASNPLLRATPDMPGPGEPVFGTALSKEYL